MGLSAISATIRRSISNLSSGSLRRSSKKAAFKSPYVDVPFDHDTSDPIKTPKPLKPTKLARNASSRTTTRRPRMKDLTPNEFVNLLGSMDTVPTSEQTTAFADRVVSDAPFFAQLISLLVNPPAPTTASITTRTVLARTRLHVPWVVSTFITHGSPSIREALAESPELLRSLASVFDVKQGALDAAHASLVAQVLRMMIYEHSRQVGTALQKTRFLACLVRHVAVQPAADLLPRFVGARVFTTQRPAPLIPVHKRAVAAMGTAKVQALLADRFVAAAADILDANSSDGLDARQARQVVRASAAAMTEVALRALHVVLKYEDHDERGDAMYAGNLGLVTSAIFNDAKRHMDFLHNTQPVATVLKIALTDGACDADVIVPVLNMVTAVLCEARLVASQMKYDGKPIDVSKLGAALAEFTPQLIELLGAKDEANKVGHIRLAVVDYICELVEGLDESSISKTLCSDNCALMRVLLNLASRFPRNNMLQVRVAKLVQLVFMRFDSVARAVLLETDIASTLLELWDDATLESAVASMIDWTRLDKANMSGLDKDLQEKIDMLDTLMKQTKGKKVDNSEVDAWALFDTRGKVGTMNTMQVGELSKPSVHLSVSEDYGQELYVQGLLEEVAIHSDKEPSVDGFVTDDAETERWGESLTALLR